MTRGNSSTTSVGDIVAATPADRDRWADAIRAGSLLVVMLGHWFMVTVSSDGTIGNVLAVVPALQPITWVLQVMPLFFLVGGVAHAHTLDGLARRGGSERGRYAVFVRSRAHRLLRPTLVFLGVWVILGLMAHLSGATRGTAGQAPLLVNALVMVPQLLWFVGIYLGIGAFAPAMYRWHQRAGWTALVVLVVAAVAVDVVRFALGFGILGNLNFALVWLAVHQAGFLWRDGRLDGRTGPMLALVAAVGFAVALRVGPYPVSMVGLPGAEVSNMAPPTAALLAQGLTVIGLAAWVRRPMNDWLSRPSVWQWVVRAGGLAMTAFLWHLTALLATLVVARVLGIALPEPASALWWWTRPLWILVLLLPTAALIAIFLRFDRPGAGRGADGIPDESRSWPDPLAVLAVVVTVFGVLMVSITGVDILGNRPQFFLVGEVTPAVAFAVLLAGLGLLRVCRPRTSPPG